MYIIYASSVHSRYAEDVVVGKVFFPDSHTAKFEAYLRVTEEVTYGRHLSKDVFDLVSLNFTGRSIIQSVDRISIESTMELADETSSIASMRIEPMVDDTIDFEEGKACATARRTKQLRTEESTAYFEGITHALPSKPSTPKGDKLSKTQSEQGGEGARYEEVLQLHATQDNDHSVANDQNLQYFESTNMQTMLLDHDHELSVTAREDAEDAESVATVCGSLTNSEELENEVDLEDKRNRTK
ncbi:hypothetical protein GN958_ATG15978 [Phytophthora infestans]|uniref:Uncharacterized protein n=1 Tax=Phytophthora infestans TaxID=4787 RepID=A0A8S9U4Y9_PHYIN|nr:hypothetical protein GN958_ATG15978 [Phytophthora infestans]